MRHDTRRRDRAVSTLSRRQAVAGGATLLAAGGTLLWTGSSPARAQVSVDALDIPDAGFEAESVEPILDITASYEYDVGTQAVGDVRLGLSVDGTEIAYESLRTDRQTLSGQSDLSGRITDADDWDPTDFTAGVGEQTETTLSVELSFAVRDPDETPIASDTATAEPVVAVSHPQDQAWSVAVGGEGTIRTATPTPTE